MNAVLLTAEGRGSERVFVRSRKKACKILGVDPGDLTYLPIGTETVLYMSRSAQRDRNRTLNRSATLIAQRVGGLSVSLRGDVLSFPRGEPWRRLAQ